jgi:hypothetical protein
MARSLLKNPSILAVMFEERRNGASLLFLAHKYRKHHTTIMWHCRKFNIVPLIPLHGGRKKEEEHYEVVPEVELDSLQQANLPTDEGPICRGKSYFEYVSEAMRQSDFKHYFDKYGINPLSSSYMRQYHQQ